MKPWLTKGTLVPEVYLEIVLRKRESEPRSGCDGVKSPMFRVFILSESFVYVEMKNRSAVLQRGSTTNLCIRIGTSRSPPPTKLINTNAGAKDRRRS